MVMSKSKIINCYSKEMHQNTQFLECKTAHLPFCYAALRPEWLEIIDWVRNLQAEGRQKGHEYQQNKVIHTAAMVFSHTVLIISVYSTNTGSHSNKTVTNILRKTVSGSGLTE